MEVPVSDSDWESKSNRTTFLKKMGVLAAVGLGFAATIPRRAQGAIACCPNYATCYNKGLNCGTDHTRWLYCEVLQCCVCWPQGSQGCQYIGGVPC